MRMTRFWNNLHQDSQNSIKVTEGKLTSYYVYKSGLKHHGALVNSPIYAEH